MKCRICKKDYRIWHYLSYLSHFKARFPTCMKCYRDIVKGPLINCVACLEKDKKYAELNHHSFYLLGEQLDAELKYQQLAKKYLRLKSR